MSAGMMGTFDTEDKVVRYVRLKFVITIIEMKSQSKTDKHKKLSFLNPSKKALPLR